MGYGCLPCHGSYIFEERLERALQMKGIGNQHFQAGEWELALRRYRRAIYYSHIDEMQVRRSANIRLLIFRYTKTSLSSQTVYYTTGGFQRPPLS
jgi:hypothetical protein